MGGLTVYEAFESLDALRRLLEISIEDVAPLCRVTPLTYKRWRKGVSPRKSRLETFQSVIKKLKTDNAEKLRLYHCK